MKEKSTIAMQEFKRLREFYRRNYKRGNSDACFYAWIELMIDKYRQEKKQEPLFEGEAEDEI